MALVRRKHIGEVVEKLLSTHNIRSGPVRVEQIIKSLGIVIKLVPDADDLSGFIVRDHKNGRTVIGVNKRHAPTRQRFTLAHELGHFLLHDTEQIHIDKRRDKKSAEGTDTEEKEANFFAAELLIPEKFIRRRLAGQTLMLSSDEDEVEELAQEFQVSQQALSFRLAYLDLIQV